MKDIRIEKITMNTMPCCTYQEDEKHIFIGYFLGGVCTQYRDSIEEYQDFQSFYSEINDQVQQLKVNYDQEIEQIKRIHCEHIFIHLCIKIKKPKSS